MANLTEASELAHTLHDVLSAEDERIRALLRTADGRGRCAANEILLKTSGLANVIREGNMPMITSIIQGGRTQGMQLMDDALMTLLHQLGII